MDTQREMEKKLREYQQWLAYQQQGMKVPIFQEWLSTPPQSQQ